MVGLTFFARAVAAGASVALLWLAYCTYANREKPAASTFGILLSILGLTALCAGATAHTGTPYKLVWLYTSLAIPLALAVFAFDYYGIAFFASRSRTGAAIAPALAGALGGTLVVLGAPAMSPGPDPPIATLAAFPPLAFDLATTLNRAGLYYTTAVMLLAVALVLRSVYRYEHLDSLLGPVIAFVGVWPWLANLFVPQVAAAFSPGVGVAAVAGGYTASVLAAALAVGPLELLESSPMAGNVGPEVVLDSMDDAVLVVDEDGRVLRLNAVAREVFGTTEPEAAGGPLTHVVGHSLDDLPSGETVPIETTEGVRQFEVTRSTVSDRAGGDRGYAIVLRDVTRRRTREQRLEVFNRILRHNLRNDATTIIGNAELVGDGGNPEEHADQIVETTRGLVGVAERAREIDRMMSAPADGEVTAVGPIVEEIAADVGAGYPSVEVTTAIPEKARASVSSAVFEVVVRNLIENAAAHNDADEPIVVVSADYDSEGALSIAIADNGPGIPEHERAVLEAGEEKPLEHGSGLGLWAVSWGITRMGGELAFSENDPRGSVVTVTVPGDDSPVASQPSRLGAG